MSQKMDDNKTAIRKGGVDRKDKTYLGLSRRVLIVAVGGSTKGSARALVTSTDTTSLGEVLLTLLLSNLDLGLLAPATKLFGLEGALGLELGAPMLGNVAVGHGCDVVRGVDLLCRRRWSVGVVKREEWAGDSEGLR